MRWLTLVAGAVMGIAISGVFSGGVHDVMAAVGVAEPAVRAPAGKYLLVECWTHSVLGVECEGLCIDSPTYHFDAQSGELAIYLPPESAPSLDNNDVGFVGSGESLGGVGCGAASGLTSIKGCPWAEGDITLRDVDETGAVTLERRNEVMVLRPGGAWVSDEEVEIWDWIGPECVVTRTHRVTNYAFQDREKIVYVWPHGAGRGVTKGDTHGKQKPTR